MANDQPTDARRNDDDVFIDASAAWDADEPYLVRPRWVKPVGIISIVLGALGLFCGLVLGVGGQALMRQMQQAGANQMQGGFPDVLLNPPPGAQAAQWAGIVWALLLIVCGGVLLARKPVARPLHLLYAVGGVALTTWGIYEQLQIQIAMREWMNNNPDADFTKISAQSGSAGAFFGLALGAVLGYSWPLFCLVWFSVVKRKPVDIVGEGAVMPPAA